MRLCFRRCWNTPQRIQLFNATRIFHPLSIVSIFFRFILGTDRITNVIWTCGPTLFLSKCIFIFFLYICIVHVVRIERNKICLNTTYSFPFTWLLRSHFTLAWNLASCLLVRIFIDLELKIYVFLSANSKKSLNLNWPWTEDLCFFCPRILRSN
jgi:hypothetical protein